MPHTPRQSHPHLTGGHYLSHRPGTAIPLGQANGGASQPSFLQHLTGGDSGARSFQRRGSAELYLTPLSAGDMSERQALS
jgi:hypothetical protein